MYIFHNLRVLSFEQDAMQFKFGNSFRYITDIKWPSRIDNNFKFESSESNVHVSISGSNDDVTIIFDDFKNNIYVISTLYGFIVFIQLYFIDKFFDFDTFLFSTISFGIL